MSLIAIADLSRLEQEIGDRTPTEELASQLVHAAKWQLENAKHIEGAKELHDDMRRAQIQFEQHRATLFARNTIAAQVIRIEWHLGKTLAAMPRGHGGRASVSNGGKQFLVAIQNVGIDKSSAYRYQNIAAINPQDLELYFEEVQGKGEEITSNGVLNWFDKHKVIDGNDDGGDDNDGDKDEQEEKDEPETRLVTIACKSCGAIHQYEIAA